MLVYGWIYEIHALMIFKATDSKSNVFNWPVMGQSQILTDITYMEERDECMAMKKNRFISAQNSWCALPWIDVICHEVKIVALFIKFHIFSASSFYAI